jgi:hypothetical protein
MELFVFVLKLRKHTTGCTLYVLRYTFLIYFVNK